MFKKALPLFLLCLLFCSALYAQKSDKIDSSMMVTLRINPRNVKAVPVSDIFEEVNFIPLETTKESKISKIDILRITKNNIVVYDQKQLSFLIFDKQGKYINKITPERIRKDWAGKLRNFTSYG